MIIRFNLLVGEFKLKLCHCFSSSLVVLAKDLLNACKLVNMISVFSSSLCCFSFTRDNSCLNSMFELRLELKLLSNSHLNLDISRFRSSRDAENTQPKEL